MGNICLFMPEVKDYLSVQIINYVLENDMTIYEKGVIQSVYRVYIVKDGKGVLSASGKDYEIKTGDVFITVPSFKFLIKDQENLSFMYVSFMGRKGNMMIDKLKVSSSNFLFRGFESLIPFWVSGFEIKGEINGWMAESVLLYTFSHLADKTVLREDPEEFSEIIKNCKKFIDENFYDSDLSLKSLSDTFFYNPKYISAEFKKKLKIGVNDYISKIRIQHAVSLFAGGIKSVKEVSFGCGFTDSQYFTKVFKKITGYTPSEYKKNTSENFGNAFPLNQTEK